MCPHAIFNLCRQFPSVMGFVDLEHASLLQRSLLRYTHPHTAQDGLGRAQGETRRFVVMPWMRRNALSPPVLDRTPRRQPLAGGDALDAQMPIHSNTCVHRVPVDETLIHGVCTDGLSVYPRRVREAVDELVYHFRSVLS